MNATPTIPKRSNVQSLQRTTKLYFVTVFYEPTDIPIAANIFSCEDSSAVKFISPNLNELKIIAKTLNLDLPDSKDPLAQAAHLGRLVAKHVDTLIITLGSLGLMIVRRGKETDPMLSKVAPADGIVHVRYYKTEVVKQLVNVSGAGDCLASGIITAMLLGYPENICVSVGFAAARMSLQSASAVPSQFFDKSHIVWSQPVSHSNF